MAQQSVVPARQNDYALVIDSLLPAENGDIVGLTGGLSNVTTDTVKGRLEISVPSSIVILGNLSPNVTIAPKGKQFLPVKFQVGADAAAGRHTITIRWIGLDNSVLASAQTTLEIQPKRAVLLQALNPNELMHRQGDSLVIHLTLRNAGNQPEQVKVIVSMPDQYGGRRFAERQLKLMAADDTTVVFGYIIDRTMISLERFTVNVAGMYSDGELFGNASIYVQNASSHRQYKDPNRSANRSVYQPNRIVFMARNLFQDNQSWQLNGSGSYQLTRGKLDFSTFAYQWGGWGNRPVLNNTWINYEYKNKGITIGNIAENLETYVNGRGIKVYVADSLKSKYIEVGVVDRTFDLLGSDYRTDFGNGFTAYFRTRLGEGIPERKRYTGTAIYERLPAENSESILYMNSFDLVGQGLKDKIQLIADLGPAIIWPLYRSGGPVDTYQPALASGLQLNANIAGYTLNSVNYYSTGYYPGIRRGALQLNQRVSRRINRANAWIGYSLYRYTPKYFEVQPRYRTNVLVSRVEAGASFPLTDFLSLSVTPFHEFEKGAYAFGTLANTPLLYARSYRLNGTLNWRSRHYQHAAYLTMESGMMQSAWIEGYRWQMRANLSYNYAWFHANANIQRGNFSLIEAANNWYFGRSNAYRVGASAAVRKDLMRKRIQAEAGLSYYKDSFSGENWTGNGRVQYAVNNKTAFFLVGQVYRYSTAYYPGFFNTNFQLGIQQALPENRGREGQKRGNISIFVYYDNDTDGRYNEGDVPAQNVTVLINNTIFITGNNGRIAYDRVPYGAQHVSVPVQHGWYAPVTSLQLSARQVSATLALQQAGTVTGHVKYVFDERISYEANTVLGGFTITAKNTATGQTTRAVTDSQGNYVLFLPAGSYEFSMLDNKMPQYVSAELPVQQAEVKAGEINSGPLFILKVEEKKVEVKRFSSP
ncbi:carboxypeptidase-like regulatory domain-containing protein [Parapedobacter koreensis]|uniref:carboxypeptidase-like regulatory domain-containing protein n=1 Tax=Parapedobacter koreensis TaxID=332977 RepID=UPI000B84E854|nr:carboxypeptidase-like regulatory domain-containing protein [Parapedobacter koreensis]